MYDEEYISSFKMVAGHMVVPEQRCWILWTMVKRVVKLGVPGEFWECGVFRGGSARMIADVIRKEDKTLRLFDTFTGIPYKSDVDKPIVGQFSNTDEAAARRMVSYDKAVIHKGLIPFSFAGLGNARIAFCHIDVDMYRSVRACCEFVWPRLAVGGVIVFDDYAVTSCPGARIATDEFFADKKVHLVPSIEGGAVAVKLPEK
jgi:O-methyltransferase